MVSNILKLGVMNGNGSSAGAESLENSLSIFGLPRYYERTQLDWTQNMQTSDVRILPIHMVVNNYHLNDVRVYWFAVPYSQ